MRRVTPRIILRCVCLKLLVPTSWLCAYIRSAGRGVNRISLIFGDVSIHERLYVVHLSTGSLALPRME